MAVAVHREAQMSVNWTVVVWLVVSVGLVLVGRFAPALEPLMQRWLGPAWQAPKARQTCYALGLNGIGILAGIKDDTGTCDVFLYLSACVFVSAVITSPAWRFLLCLVGMMIAAPVAIMVPPQPEHIAALAILGFGLGMTGPTPLLRRTFVFGGSLAVLALGVSNLQAGPATNELVWLYSCTVVMGSLFSIPGRLDFSGQIALDRSSVERVQIAA